MTNSAADNIVVVTIDGPSGSGKSTAARKLAQRLGFAYLDTGAMYRAVTLEAMRKGINLRDSAKLIELTQQINLDLIPTPDSMKVQIDSQDVTDLIRTVEVTQNSHFIASRRGVRDQMVKRQRRLAKKLAPLVTEGRDQGSVVFPNAQVKFFLDADPNIRAKRRHQQISQEREDVTYDQVLAGLKTRDSRDTNRNTAPLEVPPGAIIIDSTDMSVEQMIDELVACVERVRSALDRDKPDQ